MFEPDGPLVDVSEVYGAVAEGEPSGFRDVGGNGRRRRRGNEVSDPSWLFRKLLQ